MLIPSLLVAKHARRNYHIQSYLSFIEYKGLAIVRRRYVTISSWFDTGFSFKDPNHSTPSHLRATSHTRLKARDHYNVRALVDQEGGDRPSSHSLYGMKFHVGCRLLILSWFPYIGKPLSKTKFSFWHLLNRATLLSSHGPWPWSCEDPWNSSEGRTMEILWSHAMKCNVNIYMAKLLGKCFFNYHPTVGY